ncbi:unnamed protein product [Alternaria alternata]
MATPDMEKSSWLSSLTNHGSKPPFMLKVRSSDAFIVGTISLAVFTDMFLYGVIVPVIPFAIGSLSHVEDAQVQYWVSVLVAVYGAALLAFSPICGERLATATGWLTIGVSLGMLISPILGGVVYDKAGYNAVFGMCYALVGLDVVLRLLLVEKKVAARWDTNATGRPSVDENAYLDKTITPVIAPAGQDLDQDASKTVLQQEASFVETQQNSPPRRRLRDRLPPVLSLLYSRRLLASLFCALIQAMLLTAFDSVLTIHAANTFNWNSTGAALLFLPIIIPSLLSPLWGWLSDKYGGRYVVVVRLPDKVLICALLAVTGLFVGMTFAPVMAEISAVAEAKEKKMIANGRPGFGKGGAFAQAYALYNCAFAGGCMVGPLLAGFLVEDSGWGTMAAVLGALSAVTAVPGFLWLGGWVLRNK